MNNISNFKAGLMLWWRYFIVLIIGFLLSTILINNLTSNSFLTFSVIIVLLVLGILWGSKSIEKKIISPVFKPALVSLFAVIPTFTVIVLFQMWFTAMSISRGYSTVFFASSLIPVLIGQTVLYLLIFVGLKIFCKKSLY